jgi:hypothetical protein
MPHLKCEACRLRIWRVGDTDEEFDTRCPSCAGPLEPVARLEELMGFQVWAAGPAGDLTVADRIRGTIEGHDLSRAFAQAQVDIRRDPLS